MGLGSLGQSMPFWGSDHKPDQDGLIIADIQ